MMSTRGSFDESIAGWLEQTAPARLPERVLEATFERTRTSRQRVDWRRALGRSGATRPALTLGGAAVIVVAAAVAFTLFGSARQGGIGASPRADDPRQPFLGVWISTSDADSGTQMMTVTATAQGTVEVMVHDTIAMACSGSPSTMTGAGSVDGDRLVIPAPDYTCDDGREPRSMSGLPLDEQLRNLTYARDARNDSLNGVWVRAETQPSATRPATQVPVWPQTSLEEVRQAQKLADVGDPRYTWQIDTDLGTPGHIGQHHPHDAKIFTRFMEEVLGWEAFRDGHHMPRPGKASLLDGDVVYIRCASGGTNPLYPDSPDGGCAPTLDELRYETVKINVAQLDRQGPRGIWVVTDWEMVGPAEQAAPPSDAEIAASLGAFLQARIDGEGAERFLGAAAGDPNTAYRVDQEALLLYATTTGARYERSEFALVDGPAWPSGGMQFEVRLFADAGRTVVEQAFTLERDEAGRLRLGYGGEGDGPGTTENGKAVPVEYGFLDDVVTFRAAHPLAPSYDEALGPNGLAIEGLLPDDGAPRQVLLMLADPQPVGPGCEAAPAPADAEALARSIQADPDFDAGAPRSVTIGGIPALQMDVLLAPGVDSCVESKNPMPKEGRPPLLVSHAPFFLGPDRARLYLVDLPAGSKARVLALATITDEDSFETVLEWAKPVVDSIEFHAP